MSSMLSCLVVKRERAAGAEQLDSTCLLDFGHHGERVQRKLELAVSSATILLAVANCC